MKSKSAILGLVLIASIFIFISCGDKRLSFDPGIEKQLPETIDFNYHVRPIISDKCFACHGPDENKLEAGLRLDLPDQAIAQLASGAFAIVPGKLHKSEVYHRIVSEEEDYQMPPPESRLSLSEYEKAILIRWIDEGAVYKPHWSFIPPKVSDLPEVVNKDWVANPIDQFILSRLEKEGINPTDEADKITLIRRLTFDLTGLPPTLEEIDAFLADNSLKAYENLVDRLLASPHYGERMAMDWLDVARYADSHGFHADGYRRMWPWRDWVINAFNKNLPYDEFVTWQIAGDLLPDAGQEQQLATAFHRNNPINSELGIVPEEYRLENVFDRTNTTAKAFLGLTLECARCHDHKYDPISQKEYYQFAAFFNNVDELGMVSNDGNAAPTMPLMTEEVTEIVEFIQEEIKEEEEAFEIRAGEVREQKEEVEIKVDPNFDRNGLIGYFPLNRISDQKTVNRANVQQSGSLGGEVKIVEGHSGTALHFDSEYEHLSLGEIGNFERTQSFSMGAWVYPEKNTGYRTILGNAGSKNEHWRGYELFLDTLNQIGVRLVHNPPGHSLVVASIGKVPLNEWTHVLFSYDGSSKAKGIRIYINGKETPTNIHYDHLDKSILTIDNKLNVKHRPIRVGRSYRVGLELGVFEGRIDEIRIYNRELTALETAGLAGNRFWENTAEKALGSDQQNLLLDYYLHHQDLAALAIKRQLSTLREQIHTALDTVPEIMILREMPQPRKTYVLDRGLYDAPREEVQAGTPEQIFAFKNNLQPNRLGLSRWLMSEEHPLTARVIVNRYWHLIFGRGIVYTLEDFGSQGALPTHPELLDWLALEFVQSGWDLKALIRLMVTSATYRQSSLGEPALLEIDPQNEFLARGPSHRLPAEMIRDNALQASGLLVKKIGGPSVKTYQPEGLWGNTHFSRLLTKYEPDQGEDLYRRSMYTFIRRTAPPPTMTVLDAPDRSFCTVQRQNTNTPLQALLLLNEPQMVEASRLLSERVLKEIGPQLDTQLNYAFRLLTSHDLTDEELPVMTKLYEEEYEKYCLNEKDALQLLAVGDFPRDESLELPAVAAMTVVSNLMMNHYRTYTKR